MCGIVGYVGGRDAVPVILDGLRRLEYRGYDSAGRRRGQRTAPSCGAARPASSRTSRRASPRDPLSGGLGPRPHALGHPRAADRGERPPAPGLHRPHRRGPQRDHREPPRAEGPARGRGPPLRHPDRHRGGGPPGRVALRGLARAGGAPALAQVQGVYALVLDAPRRAAPPGRGAHGAAARDRPRRGRALRRLRHPGAARRTRATSSSSRTATSPLVCADAVRITNLAGEPIARKSQRIAWDPVQAEKGGYRHFMLKEIHEQPRGMRDTLLGRISLEEGEVHLEELGAGRRAAEGGEARRAAGLRHQLARGARRQVLDRAPRRPAGRGRLRQRVPLPHAARRPRHGRDRDHAERRDGRHARGVPRGQGARGRSGSRSATCRARCSRARRPARC